MGVCRRDNNFLSFTKKTMLKRRSFFSKLAGTAGALGFLSLPLSAMQKSQTINGRFMHMVFFWLKDSTDVDAFIESTQAFVSKVEVVKAFHFGKPAGTPREVVDNSYSVSLVVTFDSREDQDVYQKHPAHVQYVEDNKDKWTAVKIFDSWGVE